MKTAASALTTSLLILAAACAQQRPSDTIPPASVVPTPIEAPRTNAMAASGLADNEIAHLAEIGEKAPVSDQAVWLQKKFWLGRQIWVSLGVERASVTGLAMSVLGFIPAQVDRRGLQLVLTRRNDGLFGGTTLGPDLPLQIYPIIGESDDAVLVDLASPVTKFGLTTLGLAPSTSTEELQPRLEYLKAIEVKPKSLALHTVVVAQSPKALYEKDDESAEAAAKLDPNLLALSLRTDWVLDAPTPDFTGLKADSLFGLFVTDPLVRDGGTRTETFVNRIRQKAPFIWEMTANTPELYRDAVKAGVEQWNQALPAGTLQLQARVADGSRSFTDPSVSNIVWDDNEAIGMAFANWRENPYTGEIIQAQVYMSGSMWANNAKLTYQLRRIEKTLRASTPAPATSAGSTGPVATAPQAAALKAARVELAKLSKSIDALETASKHSRRLSLAFTLDLAEAQARRGAYCARSVNVDDLRQQVAALQALANGDTPATDAQGTVSAAPSNEHMPYPADGESDADFAKDVVRAVVFHEVGHTLGLRHNFLASKGTSDSGRIQSASIMDYNDLVVDASFDRPGDADKAILAEGYLGTPTNVAFCTDEHAQAGMPDCQPFDHSSEPINGLRVRQETNLLIAYRLLLIGNAKGAITLLRSAINAASGEVNYLTASATDTAEFLKDPNFPDRQKKAMEVFETSRQMLGVGYPPELQAQYSQLLIQVLAKKVKPATSESAVFDRIVDEFVQAALDTDGSNEITTRLAAIDGLRRLQDLRARKALRDVRARIMLLAATSGRGVEQSEEDDETARAIERLLDAGYFAAPAN